MDEPQEEFIAGEASVAEDTEAAIEQSADSRQSAAVTSIESPDQGATSTAP